jgi:hypothetical protein
MISPTGEATSKGWAYKRLKDHRMTLVTACGRYAVAVSPRDHFFRSKYGLFSLKMSLESGSLKDEPIDNLSWQVNTMLKEREELLNGVSTGYWIEGQRIFSSSEMNFDPGVSVESYGRSFVSYNKVVSQTAEGTPIQGWEGRWSAPDMDILRFMPNEGQEFGILSQNQGAYELVSVTDNQAYDILKDSTKQEISWEFETGKYNFGSATNLINLSEGYFEAFSRSKKFSVKILVKTDKTLCWKEWKTIEGCDKEGESFFVGQPLGRPDTATREGSWFQFRVEGTGSLEINSFNVDFTLGDVKTNRAVCIPVS